MDRQLPGHVDPEQLVPVLQSRLRQSNEVLQSEQARSASFERDLAAKTEALERASKKLKIATIVAVLLGLALIARSLPALWELIK